MNVFVYDGSFEGLLSCLFEVYRNKQVPDVIVDESHHQPTLMGSTWHIITNEEQADRVLKGIDRRTQDKASLIVYKMFLSELPLIELSIYHFVRAIIDKNDVSVLENYANEFVLKAHQIVKMMGREIHRMHAFVRFQKTKEGVFYASIEPDFNVLPLLGEHFEKRYADQSWVIFDTKRHYGLYYDQKETVFITMENPSFNLGTGELKAQVVDEKEKLYQALWENYFQSVNIKERKNLKLHLRHVPKRYWKYLTEKKNY